MGETSLILLALLACTADKASEDPDDVDAGLRAPLEFGRCAPPQGEGASCQENQGCAPPLACITGRCAQESLAGEPCDSNADCIDDHHCQRLDEDGRELAERVCAADVALGEPCTDRIVGACATPGSSCIRGVCALDSETDGPCEAPAECVSGHWCDKESPAPDGELGVCAVDRAEGADCELHIQCGDLKCVDGQCGQPRGDGGACDDGSQCADDHYCDEFLDPDGREKRPLGTCQAESAVGQACDPAETSQCTGSSCVEGVCVDDVPAGEPCLRSIDCEDGLYCEPG